MMKYRIAVVECRDSYMDWTRTLGRLPQPAMSLNRIEPAPPGGAYDG